MKKSIVVFLFILMAAFSNKSSVFAETGNGTVKSLQQSCLTEEKTSQIESWIKSNMKDGKIPGISVVIVEGDKTIYNKGFGYSNVEEKKPVTSDTLFELGSASKAFTALGILKLEKEGLIHLDDPVNKYVPWFRMEYTGNHKGENIDGYVDITLEQLLHHTSGIPFKSIGDIPIDDKDDALEKTVMTQVDQKLDFFPGDKFLYATINYDILALVIQNISHTSYEDYMGKSILGPLGLNSTYLLKNKVPIHNLASGYKVNFLKPVAYNAPVYRGNTPAGYITTNASDLAKWIGIQLGTDDSGMLDRNLIYRSHQPDRTVAPSGDGSSYASGWSVFQDGGGVISHGGSNPNYSSFITFRPREKIGIGVLANMNSLYTEAIANGINKIIQGEKPKKIESDTYISIDNAAFVTVLISFPIALATLYLLLILVIQVIKKERVYIGNVKRVALNIIFFLLFLAGFGYCMYRIPDVLYWGLPWSFIKVWAPQSFLIGIVLLVISAGVFCVYFVLITVFTKSDDKPLFVISILSIVSGFGNALIIFIINETLSRTNDFQAGLLLFFALGIVVYVFGQRLVRMRLLMLTNELIYNKRVYLVNKVLNASYEKIEQLESGKIYAGLNNDTETLSNVANIIITSATSMVTLICCFVYLGIINLYGLLISIFVIFIAAGLYFVVANYAHKLWEQTRDIQNIFFNFINNLIHGFKELKMHDKRRNEFENDMRTSCEEYRNKRILGDLSFANVFVIGELLFTLVVGVVAFVFPVIFKDIQNSTLRNYVFIFIYMTGPVHGVLNSIPQITNVRISHKRLQKLAKELETTDTAEIHSVSDNILKGQLELKLTDVEYSYKKNGGEAFKVGPISCSFKSGEITFITGGNGSGKSTLAKLLTGLYQPDKGDITLNSDKLSLDDLRLNFSTVFSDYHLFDKLYGIDYSEHADKIKNLLKILQIDDKLTIDQGVFSTTKLSSGQKKRLALLVGYLEDRKIYLFDEWTADQDPEFRRFFYEHLLADLKKAGKCIIAITHDDRYYSLADRLIKLEFGEVSETA